MRKPLLGALTILFVGAALTTTVGCAQAPAVRPVVDAVFQAYGGRDALKKVEAVRLQGDIVTTMGARHGRFVRIVEGSDRLEVLLHYPHRVEIRIVDGEKGWNGNSPQTLAEARGPMLAAMQLQASRSWIPWILDEMQDSLQIEHADSTVVVMSGGLVPGQRLRFYVDAHTHRVLRTESDMAAGGMQMEFATDYGDFRRVDGLLVPFREESFAGKTHTASLLVDTAQVNPPEPLRKLPVAG